MSAGNIETIFRRNSLTVRWNTVLFPISLDVFANELDSAGYILDEKYLRLRGHRPTIEIEASILARKGSAAVVINPDRGYIGVSCLDPVSLVDAFVEMESIVEDRMDYASQERAWFYEYNSILSFRVHDPDFGLWESKYQGAQVVSDISSLVGIDLKPIGIRLATSGDVTGPEWTDLRINPAIPEARTHQQLRIDHRRRQREEVVNVAKDIQSIAHSIARFLEG